MFFLIDDTVDLRYPHIHMLSNGLILHTDAGWTVSNFNGRTLYAKGYAFDMELNNTVGWGSISESMDSFLGNFALIVDHQNGFIELKHDIDRSFPLWHKDKSLGNIGLQGTPIWTDQSVTINYNKEYNFSRNDVLNRFATELSLTSEQIKQQMMDRLIKYFNLLKNFNNIKYMFSGGIDTMLCLAAMRYTGVKFENINYEYWSYDQFSSNFHKELKNFWGYKQMHHWDQPTMLVTGAMGDENFVRNPGTVNTILNFYNLTLDQVITTEDYHWDYFTRSKNTHYFDTKPESFETWHDLRMYLLNINANDHQHWHLGHTLTFTPLKDLTFYNLALHLPKYELIDQMCDATLHKSLIGNLCPELLDYLSSQKNTNKATIWKLYNLLS